MVIELKTAVNNQQTLCTNKFKLYVCKKFEWKDLIDCNHIKNAKNIVLPSFKTPLS